MDISKKDFDDKIMKLMGEMDKKYNVKLFIILCSIPEDDCCGVRRFNATIDGKTRKLKTYVCEDIEYMRQQLDGELQLVRMEG